MNNKTRNINLKYVFYENKQDYLPKYLKIGYKEQMVYEISFTDLIDKENECNSLTDNVQKQYCEYFAG